MSIETSTLNLMLSLVIALQGWMIKEIYGLKARVGQIAAACPRCRASKTTN